MAVNYVIYKIMSSLGFQDTEMQVRIYWKVF